MESIKKKKYTIEEKLKVLEEIKTNSIHSITKKYGIDRSSIRDWKNKKIILNIKLILKNIELKEMVLNLNYLKKKKMNLYHGFYKIENLIYQLLLLF